MVPKQELPELAVSISGLVIHKKHPSDKIIALAGNPNVGKSTVFNALAFAAPTICGILLCMLMHGILVIGG